MEILEKYAGQMQEDLHAWAKEHAEASNGLFVPLENRPEDFSHQKIMAHTVDGSPVEAGAIDSIAKDVDPRYLGISSATEDDKNANALDLMFEVLKSRGNVVFGTDHQELVDVALMLAKVTTHLKNQAIERQDKNLEFDSAILINKMAAWLGVDLNGDIIPVTELLSMAFDAIYMSIPSTVTSKEKMTVPRRAISSYNSRMVEYGLERRLKASHGRRIGRAMLLGVALSGTVNKILDTKQSDLDVYAPIGGEVYVLGRANTGMLRFMRHSLTVLACARMDEEETTVDISDRPLSIHDADDLNLAMSRLTELKNQSDPSNLYVYDKDGNFPVLKRS